MPKATGISASSRIEDLEGVALEFNEHLEKKAGNVLDGTLRCAVAQCARDALRDCGPCQTFTKDDILKPNVTAFRRIAQLKHEPRFDASDDPRAVEAIVNLVHTLVNHQNRLDEDWYLSTCVALQDSRLVPSTDDGESRQFMVWSLFCEICLLTVISHAINITFLVLDKEPPPLPRTSSTVPTYIDFHSILRKDRKVHQMDHVSLAPYYKPSDVDINSDEISKLSPEAFQSFRQNMNIYYPTVAMVFAPEDLSFLEFMEKVYYINGQSETPYKLLDPSTRCSDKVTRHDLEVLAVAIAKEEGCSY